VLVLMLVLVLVLLMLVLRLMLLGNSVLWRMLWQPLFTVPHRYLGRTVSHRRRAISHRRRARRRGAAVMMLGWRAVGMRVALVPLSEVIWRGRSRTFRAARVCHANGRHRVHGRHVMRSMIGWGVAVVRMVWAWRTVGRWRGAAASPPRGWGVLDAIYEWGLHHVATGRGL
jgi:hypothetical protein